jgi:hypothetical protein
VPKRRGRKGRGSGAAWNRGEMRDEHEMKKRKERRKEEKDEGERESVRENGKERKKRKRWGKRGREVCGWDIFSHPITARHMAKVRYAFYINTHAFYKLR